MATREVGVETLSNGLTENVDNSDKGSENMAAVADSVTEPSWTSKLLHVQLPKTAYEITENWIPKLLGVQLPSWAPKLLGMQFTGIYQNMPAFHNPYQGD